MKRKLLTCTLIVPTIIIFLNSCIPSYQPSQLIYESLSYQELPTSNVVINSASFLEFSSRGYLTGKGNEDIGYGIYAYLLFNDTEEDNAQQARYLQAINTYLQVFLAQQNLIYPDDSDIGVPQQLTFSNKSKQGIVYLPLLPLSESEKDAFSSNTSNLSETLLQNYDFPLSRSILGTLGTYSNYEKLSGPGPFLVALGTPLSQFGITETYTGVETPDILVINMSRFDEELIQDVTENFAYQILLQNFTNRHPLDVFSIGLRSSLADLSDATVKVVPEVSSMRSFLILFLEGKSE